MADKRLPVVVVHGVGSGENQDRAGFSLNLARGVNEAPRPVKRVGLVPDESGALEHVRRTESPRGILWEEALWESDNAAIDQTVGVLLAARFPGISLVLEPALDVLVDVPAYLIPAQGRRIRASVRNVIKAHPNCVVVAHSLGSMIAVDILREAQLKDDFASLPVSALVTLGSPLAWLGQRKAPDPGGFPFRWLNYYYPQDPVNLNRGLPRSVAPGAKNRKLGAHEGFVVSHVAYWTSSAVANAVFRLTMKGGAL
ncbi:MAG: hypothetical protein ACYTGZ_17085 [Planctomycetota bacterium]|jgi:pimeloyl-ACP methyl ester carboxylesterase